MRELDISVSTSQPAQKIEMCDRRKSPWKSKELSGISLNNLILVIVSLGHKHLLCVMQLEKHVF